MKIREWGSRLSKETQEVLLGNVSLSRVKEETPKERGAREGACAREKSKCKGPGVLQRGAC